MSQISCKQNLCLPCGVLSFMLTARRPYNSTSLILFAVCRSASSLNIAFAIAFMSTWEFNRSIFFPGWLTLHTASSIVLCTVCCSFGVCSCWKICRSNSRVITPPNTVHRANIFTWHSESEPRREHDVEIHCCYVLWEVSALLWSTEELFTARLVLDEF